MAAPTPVTATQWDGTRGLVRWYAAWTDGTQLSDSVVVDISTLSPAPDAVKIRRFDVLINGDVSVSFEFDASTDALIDRFVGQSDITNYYERCYDDGPSNGFVPTTTASGFTGDILLTTVNAASGDEINALIIFERS
jgi:Na+-translocating ferredoxin:NAD+ oxidoreductase RnfG subunit